MFLFNGIGSLCIEECASDGSINMFALDAIRASIYAKHTREPLRKAGELLLQQANDKLNVPEGPDMPAMIAMTVKGDHQSQHPLLNDQSVKEDPSLLPDKSSSEPSSNKVQETGKLTDKEEEEEEVNTLDQISLLLNPVFTGIATLMFSSSPSPRKPHRDLTLGHDDGSDVGKGSIEKSNLIHDVADPTYHSAAIVGGGGSSAVLQDDDTVDKLHVRDKLLQYSNIQSFENDTESEGAE